MGEIRVPMGEHQGVSCNYIQRSKENHTLGYRNKLISIFSDSQVALRVLDSFALKSVYVGLLPFLVPAGEAQHGYPLMGSWKL